MRRGSQRLPIATSNNRPKYFFFNEFGSDFLGRLNLRMHIHFDVFCTSAVSRWSVCARAQEKMNGGSRLDWRCLHKLSPTTKSRLLYKKGKTRENPCCSMQCESQWHCISSSSRFFFFLYKNTCILS